MEIYNNNLEYVYKFNENSSNKNSTKSASNYDLDKNAFLRLLTVQLSNQDPLNPMEDREFIAQLAQFSTLEQMQNMNATISSKSEELLDFLDEMNFNQIDANIEILKQLISIRKAIEAYGIEKSPEKDAPVEESNLDNVIGE